MEQVNFIKNPQDIIFKKNVNQPSIHSGGMKLILNPYFVICDMFWNKKMMISEHSNHLFFILRKRLAFFSRGSTRPLRMQIFLRAPIVAWSIKNKFACGFTNKLRVVSLVCHLHLGTEQLVYLWAISKFW